jgi:hypothetical protein
MVASLLKTIAFVTEQIPENAGAMIFIERTDKNESI